MSSGHVAHSSSPSTNRGPSSTTTTPTTTALVLEFVCLYTHDIKRKNQKRWQDARLKYHTYNKRIVVHDDRGNYVGDAHWTGAHDELCDGEEVRLDRGGVLVQVCEAVGQREQDLGELVDKRAKEVEARRRQAAVAPPAAVPRPTDNVHFQLIQRPLSGILQQQSTPGRGVGRIGRALVPKESPYEARLQQGQQDEEKKWECGTPPPPSSKRRRGSASPPGKSGHARALFGTQLTLSARPTSTPFSKAQLQQYQPLHDKTNLKVPPSSGQDRDKERDKDGGKKRHADGDQPAVERRRPKKLKSSKPQRSPESAYETEDADVTVSEWSEWAASKPPRQERRSRPQRQVEGDEEGEDEEVEEDARSRPPPKPSKSCKQPKASTNKPPSKSCPPTTSIPPESEDEASGGEHEAATPSHVTEPMKKVSSVRSNAHAREGDDHTANKKVPATKTKSHITAVQSQPAEQILHNQARAAADLEHDSAQARGGPRTELRIRSRKKRGLLMLSERVVQPAVVDNEEGDEVVAVTAAVQEEGTTLPGSQVQADTASSQSFEEWLLLGDTEPAAGIHTCFHEKHAASKPAQVAANADMQRSHHNLAPGNDHDPGSPSLLRRSESLEGNHAGGQIRRDSANITQNAGQSPSSTQAGPGACLDGDVNDDDNDYGLGNSIVQRTNESAKASEQTLPAQQLHRPHAANNQSPTIESGPSQTTGRSTENDQSSPPSIGQGKQEQATHPRPRSKPNPKSSSTEANAEVVSNGPRIARMPRKSIKSREIFGLQLPASEQLAVPAELATATSRIMPLKRSGEGDKSRLQGRPMQDGTKVEARGGSNSNQALGDTSNKLDKDRVIEPTRWMTNPASKGKKAASKAHAAGQVPQPMVPFDTVAAAVPQRQPAITNVQKATSELLASRPVRHTPLPGFSRANGGAWSKHAEDLLGIARPRPKGRGGGAPRVCD